MPDQAPDHQAREFAAAFRSFLDWVHSTAAGRTMRFRRWCAISWDLTACTIPW